jgi:hypothetical protein
MVVIEKRARNPAARAVFDESRGTISSADSWKHGLMSQDVTDHERDSVTLSVQPRECHVV